MSEKASHIKLGLFVIVSTTLLVAGSIMLGAGLFLRDVTLAETYFEQSVGGLEVGAPVQFRGVRVGSVRSIGFASEVYTEATDLALSQRGKIMVVMEFPQTGRGLTINTGRIVPDAVKQGLRVRPSQSGIVGQSMLELVVVDPAQFPVVQPQWTPRTPFIPATESTMQMIRSAAERIAVQLEAVDVGQMLARIDRLLGVLSERVDELDTKAMSRSVTETLENIRVTSGRLNTVLNSEGVDQAVKDLPEISRRVRSAAEQLDSLLSSPQIQQARDDLPEIAARIRSSARQLDELLASPSTKRILENLDAGSGGLAATSQDLRSVARLADQLLRQQYDDIQRIVTALRQTLDNTAELTEDAKRNPSRLIFGQPPPRREPKP